jgi:hypothetical protein
VTKEQIAGLRLAIESMGTVEDLEEARAVQGLIAEATCGATARVVMIAMQLHQVAMLEKQAEV